MYSPRLGHIRQYEECIISLAITYFSHEHSSDSRAERIAGMMFVVAIWHIVALDGSPSDTEYCYASLPRFSIDGCDGGTGERNSAK